MKAITYNPTAKIFQLKEIAEPKHQANEVKIKVNACGLNPVDAKIQYWYRGYEFEHYVPGLDVSGTIVAVGDQVQNWNVGDRLLYHGNMFLPNGGFAEYAVADYKALVKHPKMNSVDAAATPCAGWTAYRALHDKLQIRQEDRLVINGASGGVGSYASQIAQLTECQQIIGVASSKNKGHLMDLGCTDAIAYDQEDVISTILQITNGKGPTKILDCLGNTPKTPLVETLAFEGHYLDLVKTMDATQYKTSFDKGLSFHQLSLGSGHRNGSEGIKTLIDTGQKFNELITQGLIKIPPLEILRMEDMPRALDQMLQKHSTGKLVLKIEE